MTCGTGFISEEKDKAQKSNVSHNPGDLEQGFYRPDSEPKVSLRPAASLSPHPGSWLPHNVWGFLGFTIKLIHQPLTAGSEPAWTDSLVGPLE